MTSTLRRSPAHDRDAVVWDHRSMESAGTGRPAAPVAAAGPSRRELRALALIALALVGLATLVAIRLRPVPAPPRVFAPDLVSEMDWITASEGWLSAFDRVGGRTELLHTADAGAHWSVLRAGGGLETVDFFDSSVG